MRKKYGRRARGLSYQKRVTEINRIYDHCAKLGYPNREIWRRYVYPVYAITERQFYNILNASADPRNEVPRQEELFLDFIDNNGYGNKQGTTDGGEPHAEGHPGRPWR